MKRSIALLLSVIMCAFLFCACGGNGDGATADEAAETTVQPTTKKVLTEIETPFAKLKVPSYFNENVKTDVVKKDPYTLKFSAKDDTELFTLVFGGKGENLLGTLITDNGNYAIYANIAKLDPKSEKYAEYSEYQECIGDITENLKKDYEFVSNMVVQKEDNETYDIETDVCTLKYPKKWKDKVTAEVGKDAVKFSCDGTKLFDICFTEQKNGIYIGKYKDTPVYVVSYKIDDKGKSKEQIEELRIMQDDLNVITDNLQADKNFSK